ncbi:MAG TPA: amidase family protein [Syntrophales bacterium]|nr:amidase family protein [Syntrophales bacterium]HRT62135.1 amidase family protein [Syntrophales bacterium]
MPTHIFSYREPSPSRPGTGGALSGMKVALQPNMSVRGWPAEAGSKALERYVALEDATVVERLKHAGAVLVGNTRMSELGFGLAGDTTSRALSEGHADCALVTDTLGEARVAAATAGLWGFKPTYGIVSRFGLIGLVPSMESYSVIAANAGVIAPVMQVIAGRDERDFSMPDLAIPEFRLDGNGGDAIRHVAVLKESLALLSPEDGKAFLPALSRLEKAGFSLREESMAEFDLFRTVHQVVGAVEASSSAGKYDGVRYGHRAASAKNWNEMYLKSRAESFGLTVKAYLFQGAYFQFENYDAFEDACRIRARLVKAMENLLARVDAVAFPTQRKGHPADKAETVSRIYEAFLLTLAANVTGLPALQIPGVAGDGAFDPGLQLVGKRLSDARLLSAGARLHR